MADNNSKPSVFLLAVFGLLPFLPTPARACREVVVWRADLRSAPAAPASKASASKAPALKATAAATAAIDFDFAHPGATVTVDAKSLKDVQTIELHVARSFTDHTGPVVLTLYRAQDGPLPPALTKHISPNDLHPQSTPKVQTLADLVQAVLNGRAYVSVTPQNSSQTVLSGFLGMHKIFIYDTAAEEAHIGALHRAKTP